MNLFTLNNNVLSLNNIEILLVKEFEVLLSRDKNIDKSTAWSEFKFIYYVGDPLSYPNQNGFNEKNTISFACKECGFKEDYVPDEVVKAALNKYIKLRTSIITNVCQELLISFKSSADVLKKIRFRVEDLLVKPILTLDEIREVIALQKEIMVMASSIPENINRITNIQKEIENSGKELLRGKYEKSNSMDANTSLG